MLWLQSCFAWASTPSLNTRWRTPLHQFLQRLGVVVDEVLRPAGQVGDGGLAAVDAEVVVEGGEDLAEGDGALGAFAGLPVGCADDLPAAHPAARKHRARDARPVVAAAVLVDRRR